MLFCIDNAVKYIKVSERLLSIVFEIHYDLKKMFSALPGIALRTFNHEIRNSVLLLLIGEGTMKKTLSLLIVIVVTSLLSGCILSKTPSTNSVSMPLGDQMKFCINIFPSNSTYTWTLDGAPLTNTEKCYTFTALAGNHTLTVKAKHICGLDTQTWNISTSSPYLGLTPYLSFSDSPFKDITFSYFYLENFEDCSLNTPGVSVDYGMCEIPPYIDSVDSDDGIIDGSGSSGHSWYAHSSNSLTFTFDINVLGSLPTHVGLVWTDIGASVGCYGDVTFTAYDSEGSSLGPMTAIHLGDGSGYGETAEDRFFGIINESGISKITMSMVNADWECDHLQYGRK
jgi:hypothetical protein